MNKLLSFSLISICLATGSAFCMEGSPSLVALTITTADNQRRDFTDKELGERLQDLCNADPEKIVVVNTQTIHHKVNYVVNLTVAERVQLKNALLASHAQIEGAAADGTFVIDVGNFQQLPKAVLDLVYGAQQQTTITTSRPVTNAEPTTIDRLFNKTTLSACAVCALAAWIAAKQLGQSSD